MTTTAVERIAEFHRAELEDLCDAAEAAILDGSGFGWLEPPARNRPVKICRATGHSARSFA